MPVREVSAIDAVGAWLGDVNWVHFVTIPIFTGVVGWLINWSGLIMLFSPDAPTSQS